MPLPTSFLSALCGGVTDFVRAQLDDGGSGIRVLVGSPADGVKLDTDRHRLNLLFYRMEPSGFAFGLQPDEPWLVRVHVLVTPLAITEDAVAAGENDLRLLGEVVRVFHEAPVLPEVTVDGVTARPQVVLEPLPVEALNNLWATQRDLSYRPSLSYELSLVPVVPSSRGQGRPLVGAVGVGVDAAVPTAAADASAVSVAAPSVGRTVVDTAAADWAPAIAFVVPHDTGLALVRSLSLAVGSGQLPQLPATVWVAGLPGATVTLTWQTWDRVDGWREAASVTVSASGPVLDAARAAEATTEPVSLPFSDHAGQAVLYAVRQYARADGVTVAVRSDPLVVSLYEEAVP